MKAECIAGIMKYIMKTGCFEGIMKYIMKAGCFAGIILIAGLSAYSGHLYWPGKNDMIICSVTDTVFISHETHDSTEGKARYVRLKEKVNMDSLWNEALEHARNEIGKLYPDDTVTHGGFFFYRFESQMDTTIQDSLLNLKVRFSSPIPLHPSSYFKYDITYKERLIERTKAHRSDDTGERLGKSFVKDIGNGLGRSFWDRFGYSFNCGFGYGMINKKFDLYIGLGGSFILH